MITYRLKSHFFQAFNELSRGEAEMLASSQYVSDYQWTLDAEMYAVGCRKANWQMTGKQR